MCFFIAVAVAIYNLHRHNVFTWKVLLLFLFDILLFFNWHFGQLVYCSSLNVVVFVVSLKLFALSVTYTLTHEWFTFLVLFRFSFCSRTPLCQIQEFAQAGRLDKQKCETKIKRKKNENGTFYRNAFKLIDCLEMHFAQFVYQNSPIVSICGVFG